jgi:hypothetical protein
VARRRACSRLPGGSQLTDGFGEHLDERRRVRERRDGDAADEGWREPRHDPQVFPHEARDLRSLHLDDHLGAVEETRPVHLRDRGGRERRAVELGEHVAEGRAEVFLDDGAHVGERLGRDAIATLLELVDELGREDALPRRDDLSEFDVRGTESAGAMRGDAICRRDSAPPCGVPHGQSSCRAEHPPPNRADRATRSRDRAPDGARWSAGRRGARHAR